MCTAVTRGFVGVKLSGSLRKYGSFIVRTVSIIRVIANPSISFTVKYGWNGMLSVTFHRTTIIFTRKSLKFLMVVLTKLARAKV
jgi:hypothetical protein